MLPEFLEMRARDAREAGPMGQARREARTSAAHALTSTTRNGAIVSKVLIKILDWDESSIQEVETAVMSPLKAAVSPIIKWSFKSK